MAAPSPVPAVVFFTVAGDPAREVHFARRYADGRYWAANRYRGWRVAGLACRRLKPLLIRGTERRRIQIVAAPAQIAAA